MRRLSGALERLLDPLDLAEPGGARASHETTGSAGSYRTEQRLLISDAGPGRSRPERRDNLFERLANSFERFRWRRANARHARHLRRRSQTSRHRVARTVLTNFVVCLVICAVSLALVVLTVR